jgi:hypothetical protein
MAGRGEEGWANGSERGFGFEALNATPLSSTAGRNRTLLRPPVAAEERIVKPVVRFLTVLFSPERLCTIDVPHHHMMEGALNTTSGSSRLEFRVARLH